jgi:hypothetical protein
MPDPGRTPGKVVISNCVQVRLIWTLPNTKTVYNVLHGRTAGAPAVTQALAQAIFAALGADGATTNWRQQLHTSVGLAGVDLRSLHAIDQPTIQSTGGSLAGTGAGGAIPPGDAFCVTLRTAQVGQHARGRVYLPGLDFSALAAGGVASANTVTRAPLFIAALQTAMAGQGMTLCIAQPHREQYTGSTGTNHAERPASTLDVTAITARNNVLDHQRKRAGRS